MKSLAVSDRYGWARYVAHQAYYSLVGRDYEWELMPLALDQKVGAVVWSPLGWGRLTGQNPARPAAARRQPPAQQAVRRDWARRFPTSYSYRVVDALDEVADETGKTVPQIALNWLLQRPTVSTVIIGARNEEQLRENLGAVGWNLTPEQVARWSGPARCRRFTPTGTRPASRSAIRSRPRIEPGSPAGGFCTGA